MPPVPMIAPSQNRNHNGVNTFNGEKILPGIIMDELLQQITVYGIVILNPAEHPLSPLG